MTYRLDRTFAPSDAVLDKARSYLTRDRVGVDEEVSGVYWVSGTARRPYRVQTDARQRADGKKTATRISCTCKYGMQQGGGASACSHAVAALLAFREDLDLPKGMRA